MSHTAYQPAILLHMRHQEGYSDTFVQDRIVFREITEVLTWSAKPVIQPLQLDTME